MTSTATLQPSYKHDHGVPLFALFLALLLLTGAEIALYEIYRHAEQAGHPLMSKTALVLVLLIVLTLPKASIVMIYFMHLKFERQLIILLATVPLLMTFIVVLPILSDTLVLKSRAYNQAVQGVYNPLDAGEGDHAGHVVAGETPEQDVGTEEDY